MVKMFSNMKNGLLCLFMLISVSAFSQCGVYLTADDFIAGKLTDEGSSLSISSVTGAESKVVVVTKAGSKTHFFKDIYGYKNKLSTYRIISNKPYIQVCRGALNAFTPYGPIEQTKNGVVYYRRLMGFGEIVISTDLHTTSTQTITSYDELWKVMDTNYTRKVKEFVRRMTNENGDIQAVPEQTIEYYNSLQNGFVPAKYTTIKVDVMR